MLLAGCATVGTGPSLAEDLLGIPWGTPRSVFPERLPAGEFANDAAYTVSARTLYGEQLDEVTFLFTEEGFTSAFLFPASDADIAALKERMVASHGWSLQKTTREGEPFETEFYGGGSDVRASFTLEQGIILITHRLDPEF
jgi:hypothetical protein